MSTAHATPGPPPANHDEPTSALGAFYDRNYFLLRRLHSLTGIMPVGVFVIFHLFTNMQMALATWLGNVKYFQEEVDFIHSLPALLFLELFGLWLPIAFHAGLGIVYMMKGKHNSHTYRYGGNVRYSLQRWTAWISLVFIFFHVATLRWGWTFGVMDYPFIAAGVDEYPLAHATTAMALQSGPLNGWIMTLFYLVGSLAVVYHWSNGLWTAAITWGLTLTQKAMTRWGVVCLVMGVVLSLFSISAVWGARVYEVTQEDVDALKAYAESLNAGTVPH